MTVNELIEVLKCQPPDNKVLLCVTYDDGYSVASGEALFVERNDFHKPGITSIWNDED